MSYIYIYYAFVYMSVKYVVLNNKKLEISSRPQHSKY